MRFDGPFSVSEFPAKLRIILLNRSHYVMNCVEHSCSYTRVYYCFCKICSNQYESTKKKKKQLKPFCGLEAFGYLDSKTISSRRYRVRPLNEDREQKFQHFYLNTRQWKKKMFERFRMRRSTVIRRVSLLVFYSARAIGTTHTIRHHEVARENTIRRGERASDIKLLYYILYKSHYNRTHAWAPS